MTLTLMRALWLWAGALAWALIAMLPINGWAVVQCGAAVSLIVTLGWMWAGRKVAARSENLVLRAGATLPSSSYRQPIALVCGDGAKALFGGDVDGDEAVALHLSDVGCYLAVPRASRLPAVVNAVLAQRPEWAGQLCVMLVVNPSERATGSGLAADLKALRHDLSRARRGGVALPLLTASYLPAGQGDLPWLGWQPRSAEPWVMEQGSRLHLAAWQRSAPTPLIEASRARAVVQWRAGIAWFAEKVIAPLTEGGSYDAPCAAQACGLLLLPQTAFGVPDNLWQQWLGQHTGLRECTPADGDAVTRLPFPDPLLAMLSIRRHQAPLHRAIAIAAWLFAGTGAIAMISSVWQNTLLARRVSDDLSRFQAARAHDPVGLRHDEAQAALHLHAALLDNHYRHGEPLALGFGFYRGERLRLPVRDALASIRSEPASATQGDALQLDSLSLFAVGSATLKPESTAVLIRAISTLKARPGWLILITGHTDAAGHPERNQQLSLARASAVRDWIQQMANIPAHCLAVQGLGANQPISSNDTEHGRAANRRVDIRLVPEPAACLPALDAASKPPLSAAFAPAKGVFAHGYSSLFVAAG